MASPISYASANTTWRLLLPDQASWDALVARAYSTTGWGTYYSNATSQDQRTIKGYATAAAAMTSHTICTDAYTLYQKFIALMIADYIEFSKTGDLTYRYALRSHAYWCAQNIAASGGTDIRRNYCLALAYAFDYLYKLDTAIFTAAMRKAIGEKIIEWCDAMSENPDELMTGYVRDDQAAQAVGALALLGRSGTGYDFTTGAYNATTRFEEAMGWFFGGGFATGARASLDTDRYFWASGGGWKGTWYQYRDTHWIWRMLHSMKNSLVDLKISGSPYDPWLYESWTQECWKHFVHHMVANTHDFWTQHDSYRTSNPYFGPDQRGSVCHLIYNTSASTSKRYLRWLWKVSHLEEVARGLQSGYGMAEDLALMDFDPMVVGASIPPFETKFVSDPPGVATYRSHWNLETSCIIQLHCEQRYFYGHTYLDRGAISMGFMEDIVLGGSGIYKTTDVLSAYGGTHSIKWRKQSIAQSGIVLVDSGDATPHRAYCDENKDGTNEPVWVPSGLGGQYFKNDGISDDHIDYPKYVDTLRNDGGGLMWKCTEGVDTAKAMTELGDDADVLALYSNLRRAYLRIYSDYGTGADRLTLYDAKWMVIKQAWDEPMLLLVHRVVGRSASYKKRMAFHFFEAPSYERLQAQLTTRIKGYSYGRTARKNPAFWGTTQIGCWVDLFSPGSSYHNGYKIGDWDVSIVGGGTPSYGTPGPNDYAYGGVNYPFSSGAPNERHYPELGRSRAEISPMGVDQTEDYFVALIYPMLSTGNPPVYTWINETNYFGIEINGQAFKLHKTAAEFVGPNQPVDNVAPAVPTSLGASLPASRTVQLDWAQNTETDISKYYTYYRVKV